MTAQAQDFWSRRKARVAQEAEADAASMAQAAAIAEAPDTNEMSDQDILAHFDLPDPDTLTLGDDVRGFMAKAVPQHLRKRALRKLWRTNPVLACVDGLNDYDGDFTDAAMVRTGMKTAYQVGKGMLSHLQELERQADLLTAADPDCADPADQAATPVAAGQDTITTDDAPVSGAPVPVAENTASPVPRPRMRLAFAETPQPETQT